MIQMGQDMRVGCRTQRRWSYEEDNGDRARNTGCLQERGVLDGGFTPQLEPKQTFIFMLERIWVSSCLPSRSNKPEIRHREKDPSQGISGPCKNDSVQHGAFQVTNKVTDGGNRRREPRANSSPPPTHPRWAVSQLASSA